MQKNVLPVDAFLLMFVVPHVTLPVLNLSSLRAVQCVVILALKLSILLYERTPVLCIQVRATALLRRFHGGCMV